MKNEPSVEEQARYYDDWNSKYRAVGYEGLEQTENDLYRTIHVVLDIIASLPLRQPKILEIGCGTGWLSEKLCEFGDVVGVDLAPRAIEIAKERGCKAEFIAMDFLKFEWKAADFDLVVCCETFYNVNDQSHFMERMAALTKPQGYLVFSAQNKFVYDRRSDIKPPLPGQLRSWLSRKVLMGLVERYFTVLQETTVAPRGDKGILAIINSSKLTRVLNRLFSPGAVIRAKEKMGLGDRRVLLGKRRE
jgi:2-polyprenyl-3-methyl-5-hydroxy-6-metoxy-1,4-benzoquinol methylase